MKTIYKARKELEDKIHEISVADPWLKDNKPIVSWEGYSFASSIVPRSDPIIRTISGSLSEITGTDPVFEGMPYASDARHFIKVGNTPTIIFGPGDIRVAHGPNEYVFIEDMEVCVRTLALTIMRFLGYENPNVE